MKRRLNFRSLMVGGALAALATPLLAESALGATAIEGVAVRKTKGGLALTLETSGDSPQLFTASSGKTFQADVAHAQLKLAKGKPFTQKNPAPGIESVRLEAIEGDRVRLTVKGKDKAPISDIQKAADKDSVVISLDASAGAKAMPSKLPASIPTVAAPEAEVSLPERLRSTVPWKLAQEGEPVPDILVPEPEVIIDGNPVAAPTVTGAPPFLPRAVAPPVGDQSISEINTTLDEIDLGTAERVPRLVLRDASAREVLSLLARAAGLNLAFSNLTDEDSGSEPEDVRISLDIENEPVQNVFNYVLQLSGLQANRVGRTIFVGVELPDSARSLITRTIRLNQVSAEAAASFLTAQGAVTQVPIDAVTVEVIGGNDGIPARVIESTRPEIIALQAEDVGGPLLLEGVSIVADSRLNSLTLLGSPRKVAIATEFLTQLDLRRRQVAVNLRVIDIDLNSSDKFGTSFTQSIGDASFGSAGGLGILNLGGANPINPYIQEEAPIGTNPIAIFGGAPINFASQFLGQLQAIITSGNAKIITDPTLVVQESQVASINLTQEVITEVVTEVDDEGRITVETEKGQAGLTLNVNVERIDDNGFVSLSVEPTISAPASSQRAGTFEVTLLAQRSLSSGTVRVRDGQTLVLSGIIQESDRVLTSKVPILGSIPILGALFRSTEKLNERRELIVLLTPQILDDSDQSAYGYSYTPGEDVQQLLEERQAE